jgi:hypothetical protein
MLLMLLCVCTWLDCLHLAARYASSGRPLGSKLLLCSIALIARWHPARRWT